MENAFTQSEKIINPGFSGLNRRFNSGKSIVFISTICLLSNLATSQSPGAWIQKADFGGTERSGAVGFSIGSKGYIGTGTDGGFPNKKDFWEYNPTLDAWTQKANFGGGVRRDAVGFSIGTKGYIGTGINSGISFNDFWEYDPNTNVWTQKSSFGGIPRSQAVGFSIGSKGYIGTGNDNNGSNGRKNDFWEYDPSTDLWTQKTNFGGGARDLAVGFSIASKGYIGTGTASSSAFKNDFWEYDPFSDTWTQKTNFEGGARRDAVGFSIGSKGYIGTGFLYDGSNNNYNDFWEYDPSTDGWIQKTNLSGTVRSEAIGLSIGSKGYIGTGYYFGYYNDFWEYASACDPNTSEIAGDSLDNNCNGIQNENNALKFDGVNDYIDLPNESSFDFTGAMTVEVWIKLSSFIKDWQAIITKGDNSWRLQRYNNTNHLDFGTKGLTNADLEGSIDVTGGVWHHIVAVYDGSHKYLYVDGNLDVSVAVVGTLANSSYNVAIGENLQVTGRQYWGTIDEVRIWNIARTQAEIQASMNSNVCSTASGLVAYFPFNEGIANGTNYTINKADDITTNNYNGTLNGFALTGAFSNWITGTPEVTAASEICYNSIDDNCNGSVDEGCVNTIVTGSVFGAPFCPEAIVSVPFTSVGIFNTGNFYTAELSDKQGLFTTPTTIGSLSSTSNSGTITAAIPSLPKASTKYRIRVTSSNPTVTGTDNGTNLQLLACAKVTGLNASSITPTSATVSWTGISCAVKYKVQYRKQGISAWTSKYSTTTSYVITGLAANTSYEYRITTFCSSNGSSNSGATATYGFTTTLRISSEVSSFEELMTIYPNPTDGYATIQFTLTQSSHVCVKLYDVSGKEMETLLNGEISKGEQSLQLNTDHFAKGIYIVRMISDYGITRGKLIVQ